MIPTIEWPMLTDSQTWAILLACVMMIADVMVGFVSALIRHDVNNSIMREGLGHKVLMFLIIAISYILGVGLSHVSGANITIPSTEVVCLYIIVMELTSVLENMHKVYPEFGGNKLFDIRKDVDDVMRQFL